MSPAEQLNLLQVVYLIVGGILLLLGLPLYLGKVAQNRWFGVRTRRTLADPETWRTANRTTGGWLMILGAGVAGVATWTQRQGYDVVQAARLNLAVFVAGLALMVLHCTLRLRRKP